MTAPACPHCGAPETCRGAGVVVWKCGSGSDGMRSWNCERWVALRVSQLKRMERRADDILVSLHRFSWCIHKARRMADFRDACRRELDRLRGQG